ncbi:pullulanase-type alpha-1,6-glucosidase [Colwellia sp. MEBiC06753]
MYKFTFNKLGLIVPVLCLAAACQPVKQQSAQSNNTEPSEQSASQQQHAHNQVIDHSAHWLTSDILLLASSDKSNRYQLAIKPTNDSTTPDESAQLSPIAMPSWVIKKHPHLSTFQAFQLSLDQASIKQWLKQPLVVLNGETLNSSSQISYVQTGEVIDDIYTRGDNDADEVSDLGATITDNGISIKLWAPTANTVKLKLFNRDKTPISTSTISTSKSSDGVIALKEDSNTGVWSTLLPSDYAGLFYQYELNLWHPATNKIETITTTDPYSLSLSTNSVYSQIVDLNNADTQPKNWEQQNIPAIANPEDAVLYEVHVRDFSAAESQLSNEAFRGKYKAFTDEKSNGGKHLKALKQAGLTHIHLLPVFDIGTVNEAENQAIDLQSSLAQVCQIAPNTSICAKDFDASATLGELLASYDVSTGDAQALVTELKTVDKYNWGYDPFHYTVPEGSYAINPDGQSRIIEFREMVQSLHQQGFRVIMDVVYNHTHQAGLATTSVLDKIIPNYYQRLHPITGEIEQSTCCDNTATERVMMEKLMIDSLVTWARDYKIDGFRFDLMGHQPKAAMLKARAAVRAVDPDTYFYGEGWNFGEVANNRQFVQASQLELGGTEIGTFTDRLRDAVRGPGISVQGDDIRRNQGIGNGLATKPNELNQVDAAQAPNHLLLLDQLRIGLAGNLKDFPLTDRFGNEVTGQDIPYGDQPTGYALDPADTINYVSKHDNQTLWDNNQYRNATDLTTEERVRLHNQSLSYAMLAQGIPFLHMGSELLRSKSYLRDSYDYSDWFNRVDFSKQQNFYNVGLPPAEKDQANWPLIQRLLAENNGSDQPSAKDINFAANVFLEFMAIRTNSALFRLTRGEQIKQRVSFLNTGKQQEPGLIVMHLDDSLQSETVDTNYSEILVLFNSAPQTADFTVKDAAGFSLHPIQAKGHDTITQQSKVSNGKFSVPGFTTAVFVKQR